MKTWITAILVAGATSLAMAHHTPEHIEEQAKGLMPVKTALKQIDHTPVILKGYLIESKGKGKYIFKDQSAKITVYIPDDVLKGRQADKTKAVTLVGELSVDRSYQPRRVSVNVAAIK